MGSSENDVVGDQRAAAEAGAVKEETGLIRELAGGGDAAANDLAVGGTGIFNLSSAQFSKIGWVVR